MPPTIQGWDNFYMIAGSAAAALIGLQFVVIALIKDTSLRANSGTISAFGTPSVVHLVGALVISAIMSTPWESLAPVPIALGVCGLAGAGYCARVIWHARRQTEYNPVMEDWIWHMLLPLVTYAALLLAAARLRGTTHAALLAVGGSTLALLLVAIHNAWDTVTYVVVTDHENQGRKEHDGPPAP